MKARGAGQSAYLLLDVSAVLAENDVEYAVIGAMAAAVYGAIRATTDADALLSVSVARLGQLEKIFKKAGFATELRRGDADDPVPALDRLADQIEFELKIAMFCTGCANIEQLSTGNVWKCRQKI